MLAKTKKDNPTKTANIASPAALPSSFECGIASTKRKNIRQMTQATAKRAISRTM